ncbi:immunity 52 family protein [Corallococcus coralloides]|uniref:immunity 52 family protein n=1 Tax=Corallococcus coralloides TaxID=184914 RepID=UPI003850FE4C
MTTQPTPALHPDSFHAGAYWGPRKESPEECARRAAAFLDLLAACDPLLAHWNKIPKPRGKGRRTPLMPPSLPALTEAFRRGVNREPGGPPIDDLGFRVGAYNDGTGPDFASVNMKCGSHAAFRIANSCVLSLPAKGANAERILTASVLFQVVRSMALTWEPDWAVAMSRTHQELASEDGKADMWLGWVTYLACHRGKVPPLPTPVRIEPVEDKGTLIILTPERFTVDNPDHVALSRRVRELLARAGLMHPVSS